MNEQPHVHNLMIRNYPRYWFIQYGDQNKSIDKPKFRNPTTVLDRAVKKLIKTHDDNSRDAGEKKAASEAAMKAVLGQFTRNVDAYSPADWNKWGSEQLSR